MIPRIFDGKTAAIIAGGPSLIGVDWDRFRYANTIAINRAYENLPFARVLWWGDAPFFRRHQERLHDHACHYKGTFSDGYMRDELPLWVTTYRSTGREGFDPDPTCLRNGNNSAYATMNLAVHMGVARIVLFGVDMKYGPNGESHYHGGHGTVHQESTLEANMRPLFAGLVKPLAKRGVEVINASPDSALDIWPRVTVEEGIEFLWRQNPDTC